VCTAHAGHTHVVSTITPLRSVTVETTNRYGQVKKTTQRTRADQRTTKEIL